jgi:glycosyltransferase involved in cell wall biosynthesis
MTVFAQQAEGDVAQEIVDDVEYRRIPLGRTGRFPKLMHRVLQRGSSRRPFFSSPYFCSEFITEIAKLVRDEKFDIVHIQNYSQFVSVIREYNPNVRIILHMRCEWLLQLDRKMLKKRVGEADLVVSVGGYLTKATASRFRETVADFMTLANGINLTYFDSLFEGIDTEHYKPKQIVRSFASHRVEGAARIAIGSANAGASSDVGVTNSTSEPISTTLERLRSLREHALHMDEPNRPEDLQLLFVSRISPEKGVHDLLDAFEIVHQRFPTCRLRIIGPPGGLSTDLMLDMSDDPLIRKCAHYFRGDYLAMLKERMAPAIRGSVEFLGHVPHNELPAMYEQASLLVAPSLSEAFGRSPIEAMSCGVPVVGTWIGGIAETVVPFETGLLVPPANPEKLAEAIVRLLADPELRVVMGVNGWRRVAEKYTWESIAQRTLAYYEELLAARGSKVPIVQS